LILPRVIYIIGKHYFEAWLVGDRLLLRDFGPYGIMFMKLCVVITVGMANLLWNFGYCGIIFVAVFGTLDFAIILDREF
jgi:hypothetical protein